MPTHLVIGLSGVGKGTVLRHVALGNPEVDIITLSTFARNFLESRLANSINREDLKALFSKCPSLRRDCEDELLRHVSMTDCSRTILIDSGGSLVDLTSGSMISALSIFRALPLCSVVVILSDIDEYIARVAADKDQSHIYAAKPRAVLLRKQEDLRLQGLAIATRHSSSLILAWNTTIEECAATLVDGISAAEEAMAILSLERNDR